MKDIQYHRNIGISAHIDSGKTTLTERILYFTKRIHAIHEVRGKDGVGATMDSMELERERGITIQSAATFANWTHSITGEKDTINIIDTPGHVDFTIEVERSLRVLDGAILVLTGVEGVQSQSITVDRQMKRYHVPRIVFVNKCDRSGANPLRVAVMLKEKLNHKPIVMQIPIGLEDQLKGVVDLVEMKAYYFEGANGDNVRVTDIPEELKDQAQEYREKLVDCCADYNDKIMELAMEGKYGVDEIDKDLIKKTIREQTISLELTPVFMGSAHKNIGVQKLLDGVIDYLPNPTEVENKALDIDNNEQEVVLKSEDNAPLVCYAFKLVNDRYGQLTYIRVYQGTIKKGDSIVNMATGKKVGVGRLVRMHADEMVDITEAGAGDIVALFGIDCASGTTFTDGKNKYNMTSMHVPNPVIELVIEAKNRDELDNMSKALNRFTKEDPTFQVEVDKESGQTIIKGMGELHLDVYIERMRREYHVDVQTGAPQVAYRETITRPAKFEYTHKKQTGGSGQFAKIVGEMRPMEVEGDAENTYKFVNSVVGGRIPKEYIPSCDKGFQSCMEAGSLIGFPVVGIEMEVTDGAYHEVDSSDMAFQICARMAFRQAFEKAGAQILEPIMKVEITTPTEFQGNVVGNISQRRGNIVGTSEERGETTIEAEVPLSEMFGYATDLRSMTQGKAEFTMEFKKYAPVPRNIQDELIKKYGDKAKAGQR
ncbi:MAG: elongation factor G [Fibrobacter sp.]|nr:elongation factor G [Fibrobacter sp.]MDY6369879.1 elongation factor G [Fibrobacter sp.]MDY6388985.1 elongation factor G [Fibrobacter sp.]